MSSPFYIEEIVLLSVIGGLMAVDEKAGWQSLLAQPVIAAAVIGLIFGDFDTAISVGVILELVWLSILPMRGMRRPDAVAGAVVGVGTACLLVRHTGDPRFLFIISLGVVIGLITAEIAGGVGRQLHRVRENRLARFDISMDRRISMTTRLLFYLVFSVGFIFMLEAVEVAVFLPLAVLFAEAITGAGGGVFDTGAQWWIAIIPALGAGAIVQLYWHKQLNRYLVLCGTLGLVLLWFN